ncbi:uncharacterized protein OCT59_006818 [Rhizophagus irregularis]|uniref:uncharacterized protein n=1 Tax=Rhizophagus irregularis TaxID=588596 RepID=UPI0033301106|nr:hypothetical protein OCT59_006818 [Rhizophagus irregularis]
MTNTAATGIFIFLRILLSNNIKFGGQMKDHEVIVGIICYLGEPQVLNVETPFRLVKAENAKLRQAMEKNEARLAKLEEKKLLRESAIPCRVQDEHSIPQNTSIILRKPKSIQSSGETILEVSSQVLPKETKVSPDYIIVQDFVQDVSSELIDEDDIQIIDGNQELTTDMTISRSVQEIIAKDNVSERQVDLAMLIRS